jgi:glycosyltransferase involved in cell wall biosynthesis
MISVVVPVYNAERYLHRCVESIRTQSYHDIEIFLVNDGSTDGSAQICEKYSLLDERIETIHKQNGGPSSARNVAIRKCRRKFITFVDADDSLQPHALEVLLNAALHSDTDMVIGDFSKIVNDTVVMSGNERNFSTDVLLTKEKLVSYTQRYLTAPNKFPLLTQSWGRLFKASIIKDNNLFFNSELYTFEDVAFNFEFLKYAKDVYFLNRALYNLTIHTDFLSATMRMSTPGALFGYHDALLKVEEFLTSCLGNASITAKEVGGAYMRYTIIQLIRTCLQVNKTNKKEIYKLVREVVKKPRVRSGLKVYSAAPGESKIIPILIRLKWVRLLIMYCKHRAIKRYGNNCIKK